MLLRKQFILLLTICFCIFLNARVKAGNLLSDFSLKQSVTDSIILIPSVDSVLLTNVYYKKYHGMLNAPPAFYNQFKLFQFIDKWMGTPYLFGGTTFRGVDCSALTGYFSKEVLGVQLPRTAQGQHDHLKLSTFPGLFQTGDLVFFHTTRPGISHVGIYLFNNKFLHASASNGVTISDLKDDYYVKAYRAARRIDKFASEDLAAVMPHDIRVINLSGKYKSDVIIDRLRISPGLFRQLNPDFDKQVWNSYTMRLPKPMMEQFLAQKDQILAESVNQQFIF
jgi:hypothetical protein